MLHHRKCSRRPFTLSGQKSTEKLSSFFAQIWNSFSFTNSTCRKKYDKPSNQNEEIVGTIPVGCKYARFRVSSKREKCPPRVETAAGKRQTQESQVTWSSLPFAGKNSVKNSLRHVAMVAKFWDDNKPIKSLKKLFALFPTTDLIQFHLIWQLLPKV